MDGHLSFCGKVRWGKKPPLPGSPGLGVVEAPFVDVRLIALLRARIPAPELGGIATRQPTKALNVKRSFVSTFCYVFKNVLDILEIIMCLIRKVIIELKTLIFENFKMCVKKTK